MIWSSITLFLMEILGAITCYRTLISLIMSSLSHRIRTENEDWLPATIVKTDTDGRIIIDLKPDSQGLDFQETSRQGGLVIARCRRERGEREREKQQHTKQLRREVLHHTGKAKHMDLQGGVAHRLL